jgi:sugar phosphate isomerase/epimerase
LKKPSEEKEMRKLKTIVILIALACLAMSASNQAEKIHLLKEGLSAWQEVERWQVGGDVVTSTRDEKKLAIKRGNGVIVNGRDGYAPNLLTIDSFGDCRAHIEFMVPRGSNSGVYFMGRYEIQVFDSWGVKEPKHSDCGGIYQRWDEKRESKGYEGRNPKVNASLPPGQWQCFDVIFKAPRFYEDQEKKDNAEFVKVLHNGIPIHENQSLSGPTRASAFGDEKAAGPLMLQGDHGPVAYRNIWIEPLEGADDLMFNPFFAMDTGTKDNDHKTIQAQAQMLAELGYAGFGHTGLDNLEEVLSALDKTGLKLFTIYLGVNLDDPDNSFYLRVNEASRLLDGRGAILWVYIQSSKHKPSTEAGDASAVKIIRRMSDLIAHSDVKIAFYPHTNFWLETTDDALRLARKVGRPNVGVTFNLCHQLRVVGPESVKQTIIASLPYLSVVTINGADSAPAGSAGWDKLIQTLDKGSYDVYPMLKTLRELGYAGPVGLQHYGIGGNAYQNLQSSMTAWKQLNVKLGGAE